MSRRQGAQFIGLAEPESSYLYWWTEQDRAQFEAKADILVAQNAEHEPLPGKYRALAAPRNIPGFYEAFDVKEGDGMYLPPEQRVVFW